MSIRHVCLFLCITVDQAKNLEIRIYIYIQYLEAEMKSSVHRR
jgi:hypothetical protein